MNAVLDIQSLEREKIRAQETFARGQLQETLKSYDAVEPTYVRFGFLDGLVALRYNRLLVAVEADERTVVPRAVAGLTEALGAVQGGASATVVQVAEGVLKLLPAALRGLDPELEERLTLVAQRFAQPRPALAAEAFPSPGLTEVTPHVMTLLEPADAARILLASPSASLAAAMTPAEPSPGAADEALAGVELARALWEAGDRGAAYQHLTTAFDRARLAAPGLAAELQIGLLRLEDEGLPERLEYTPGLPLERRVRASLELHGALAVALSREAGFERLARRQWSHVATLAARVTERIQVRRVRGGGNAEDAEVEANSGLWRALALRHLGNLGEAAGALAPFLSRAQRCAYANVALSARVLLAAGDLAERDGDSGKAARIYTDAAEVGLPGVTRAGRALELANLIGEALSEQAGERLPWVARALAGLARVQFAEDADRARTTVSLARDLLALARVYLPVHTHQAALLWVELTAARLGDAQAAERAVELGSVLQEPLATACALLLRARNAAGDAARRTTAPTLFSQAAAEASRGAAGEIRRFIELAAATAWHETSSDGGRLDVHLRRYAEAGRPGDTPDGAGDFDVCLPQPRRTSLEPILERLLSEGKSALLHQLCVIERRRGAEEFGAAGPHPVAEAVRDWHRTEFEARRRRGLGGTEPSRGLQSQVTSAARTEAATSRALAADEAVLAFRVAPNGTLAFVHRGDGAGAQVFRVAAGAAELQGQIAELLRVLRGGEELRRDLLTRSQELFHLLLRPALGALEGVAALQIVPDGPLWSLPFSVLLGENFLCERFELSVSRHAPPCLADPGAEPVPAVAIVAGDQATSRDLRLSMLARDGLYDAVSIRTGDELTSDRLVDALGPARFLHLVGTLGSGAALALREDEAPTPIAEIASATRRSGVVGALLFGPVEGPAGRQAVGALLGGVHGGVVARHWTVDEDGEFLLEFARACAGASTARDLAVALAATRRAAIRARLPARLWAAYELYTVERE